jgi:hypothetical protein
MEMGSSTSATSVEKDPLLRLVEDADNALAGVLLDCRETRVSTPRGRVAAQDKLTNRLLVQPVGRAQGQQMFLITSQAGRAY